MPTGSDAPYMYAPSNRHSTAYPESVFDPKAISRASLISLPPKPKQQGPLIDFNTHPDSWIIKPFAKPQVEPMNPNIKKIIIHLRGTQLGLRICQLLVAIGIMFCILCIRNIVGTNAWVMRIPPGFDILITGYAIYHLIRSPTYRTPASSASYHFFALVMDAGFIPFYIFTMLLAKTTYFEETQQYGRWTTVFAGSFHGVSASNIIFHFTWVLAIVAASLHLISFGISSYLAYIFREITAMPPDMNPLEDHLTSRRKIKHKYKNSELSGGHLSQKTQSSFSLVSPVRTTGSQDLLKPTGRPVSFFHTRTESDVSYSPHNPHTANASRTNLHMYEQPTPFQASQVDLHRHHNSPSPAKSDLHSSSESSHLKSMSSSVYSGESAPNVPPKSNKRELQSDNWFVPNINDENSRPQEEDAVSELSQSDEERSTTISALSSLTSTSGPAPYQRLPQTTTQDSKGWTKDPLNPLPIYSRPQDRNFLLQPLGMNPPTPRTSVASQAMPRVGHGYGPYEKASRPFAATSGNSTPPGRSSIAAPKSKYYGDLMSATHGIRGSSPSSSPVAAPNKVSPKYPRGDAGAIFTPAIGREDKRGRVISNSGADTSSGSTRAADLWGGNGRRDVSGKMVEEGRGGWRRRVSSRRQG